MTFSSRRSLTPRQLVVGWYLRGWEKATCIGGTSCSLNTRHCQGRPLLLTVLLNIV
ncbi:hypothetical protein INR49_009839 [Caranx melampygus]|nr:hypothetical protein INR49_009839 [Caranx melampygus]